MVDRARSRSPRRRDDGDRDRPKKSGGFRWKEKRRDDDSGGGGGDERRLDRGYRGPRSPRRDRDADRYGNRHRDDDRDRRRRDDRAAPREDREKKEPKEKKEKKPAVPQSSEPMIVVHVNDRLGTKAAIPCLASDPISSFPPCSEVLCPNMLTSYIQSYSKPKWPPASAVSPMRLCLNAKANAPSRTS